MSSDKIWNTCYVIQKVTTSCKTEELNGTWKTTVSEDALIQFWIVSETWLSLQILII